ncbi:hypothetical protein BJX96DRAFT_11310 [Aspergillus floccosus]
MRWDPLFPFRADTSRLVSHREKGKNRERNDEKLKLIEIKFPRQQSTVSLAGRLVPRRYVEWVRYGNMLYQPRRRRERKRPKDEADSPDLTSVPTKPTGRKSFTPLLSSGLRKKQTMPPLLRLWRGGCRRTILHPCVIGHRNETRRILLDSVRLFVWG